MTGYRFLAGWARSFRSELLFICALTILSSLTTLALPWLAGQLLGGIVQPRDQPVGLIVGLLLVALVLTTVLTMASAIASTWTSERILARLRTNIYRHIQALPLEFHDSHRQGDMLALMTNEVSMLSYFLSTTLARFPSMLLTAGGACVLLFAINPSVAWVVPVLVPAIYVLLRLTGRRIRGLARQSRAAHAKLMWLAESHLQILLATKSFAAEERQAAAYAQATEEARQLSFAHMRINSILGPFTGLLAALAAVTMILLADGGAMDGQRDPAALFSFLLYAALLTRPVGSLAEVYGMIQMARGTLARLEGILGTPGEPGYAATGKLAEVAGEIVFRNVTFAYPGREATLHQTNLTIAPGETVALTGENGAGKSTLVSLLLRFYEPSSGQILLDGHDIATLQVQNLRRHIALVPQRTMLFNGTVRENILFGAPEADAAALQRAVALAQATEFIAQLPQGYETEIGDGGVRLSGGERQRIALARALLANPRVLVLDEATSMFDLDGEATLVAQCREALADRTVIIITHRPASLALADRVIELRDGLVREVSAGAR